MHSQFTWEEWAATIINSYDWANKANYYVKTAKFSDIEFNLIKFFNFQSSILSYQSLI